MEGDHSCGGRPRLQSTTFWGWFSFKLVISKPFSAKPLPLWAVWSVLSRCCCFLDTIFTVRHSGQSRLLSSAPGGFAPGYLERCDCPEYLSIQIISQKQQQCNGTDHTAHSGHSCTHAPAPVHKPEFADSRFKPTTNCSGTYMWNTVCP